jgi:hypothetical protein
MWAVSLSGITVTESRGGIEKDDPKSMLLWKPLEGLTQEDESVIDGLWNWLALLLSQQFLPRRLMDT